MPALIDLRRRIKSVRNTQQITQAMKSVASAKFKKTQRVVLETRPFWHNYPDMISDVAFWTEGKDHPLLQKREEKRAVGIVITSDKGLCGAFNSNLLEKALSFLEEKSRLCEVRLILIGKKAIIFFKRYSFPVDRTYTEQVQSLTHLDLREIAQYLIRLYVLNKTDAVYIIYNEFKSILAPRTTITKVLPVEPFMDEIGGKPKECSWKLQPDSEPEMSALLDRLFTLYVKNQIRHVFFESSAAEHAARMMAMDNATQNAGDIINELTLILNKIRQASITKELLEIMSAVNALAKK